jgi:hypothetical protein
MKLINRFAFGIAFWTVLIGSAFAVEQPEGQQPSAAPAPVSFAPISGGTNTAARMAPFSSEIGADFIKKVMETSAKIEAAKRRIAERQARLYESNPEIKAIRARMIETQKDINRILDSDHELTMLKMNRDILWSTMPPMPKGRGTAMTPRMPAVR